MQVFVQLKLVRINVLTGKNCADVLPHMRFLQPHLGLCFDGISCAP